jgi:hypothetical protein
MTFKAIGSNFNRDHFGGLTGVGLYVLKFLEVFGMQHGHPIAPVLLGQIHGLVGPLNEGGQFFLGMVFGHPDADGDADIFSVFR